MQLFGISFLFYFLPLFLAIYYLTPEKEKRLVLVIGSLVFYGFQLPGSRWQLPLLMALIGTTYIAGVAVGKHRWILPVSLSAMAGLLFFMKCFREGRYLPLGMSFYLFQMAGYLIDVYRKRIEPEEDLITYSAGILLFPKLLSGPLMDQGRLSVQLRKPKVNPTRFRAGLQELVLGLGIKVLLADRLGGLWNQAGVIGYESLSTVLAWLSLGAFALRLYFDFHGYSMMAVGIGKMLGFQLPRNFDEPYMARSVSAFYRRWHISLGTWFREYLYIPLGGNRRGKGRTVFNLAVVWLATGLWHGLGGNYLIWGGALGFFIINEKLWLGRLLEKAPLLGHGYTGFVILLSWVPFAVEDLSQMYGLLGRLLGFGRGLNPLDYRSCQGYLPWLLAGLVCATPWPRRLFENWRHTRLCDGLLFALFWWAIYCVSTTKQNPFMYFRF